MKPLKNNEIRGSWATLLLPIDEDESINFDKLEAEIDTLISMKVTGIYSNGTAGEFYNQTEAEFDKVSCLLAEKCNAANMPFQIGCSHMSPKISLERVKRAVALQPSAIQVILPDWFPPGMPEIIEFLRVIEEAADPVGVVLYNPPHAKKILTPQDFYQIKEAGVRLAGCKVAGGDAAWYASMRELVPDLSVFIPGHHLATGIKLGAHGAYSNVACLHPLKAQHWYETILTDMEKGLEMEKRIQLFIHQYILPFIQEQGFSNQAVDKLLAAIGGWAPVGTRLRWPYRWISQEETEKLRDECKNLLPEFFEESTL